MVGAARRRLICSLACVMATVLLGAGALVYGLLTNELNSSVDAQLRSQGESFAKFVGPGPPGNAPPAGLSVTAPPPSQAGAMPTAAGQAGGIVVAYQPAADAAGIFSLQISGDDVEAMRGTAPPGFPLRAAAAAAAPRHDDLRTVTLGGSRYRVLSRIIDTTPDGKPVVVQTAVSLAARDREQRIVLIGLAGGGLLGLALTVLGVALLTRRALAPLQIAFRRQRRFVGDAAHELRTPLALLRLEAEELAFRLDAEEEVRPLLRQVDRLARLAGDLLTLARLDHDALPREHEPVHVASLLATLESAARALAAPGVQIASDAPNDLWVLSDRDRLYQLLLILVDNACRLTPPTGRITLRARSERSAAIISVADSGPGLPPDQIPRLSEPFYRPDAARARSGGGAGLGLAIAHALARLLGGAVRLENGPEGGAVAIVILSGALPPGVAPS
ncbi:MAG TPA: ATP-binding protein, partial [Dehalococcoidia bacterium]